MPSKITDAYKTKYVFTSGHSLFVLFIFQGRSAVFIKGAAWPSPTCGSQREEFFDLKPPATTGEVVVTKLGFSLEQVESVGAVDKAII